MIVNLSSKFYKKEAIEKAASVFKDLCECKINGSSESPFEIEFLSHSGQKENLQQIADEFCNFVLGVTKDELLF